MLRGLVASHYSCTRTANSLCVAESYLKGPELVGRVVHLRPIGAPSGPGLSQAAHGRGLSQNRKARRHCLRRKFGGKQPDLRAVSSARPSNTEQENRKMTRAIGGVGVMIITSLASFGQSAPAALAFEAASVKPAAPSTNGDAGRIDNQNVTLKGLIMRAYGVKDYQITGPDWLDSAGYDVVATIPHDATAAQLPQMLQTLLAERFKLALRHETKGLPVYALVVGKNGPKLTPAEHDEGFSMRMSPKGVHIEGKSHIAGLCDFLSRTLDGAPPRAGTGKGPENMPGNTGGASLFTALQERLGLKLEQRKTPADFLIVDRVEKVPVEN
jgi:hypothetical protein